MPLIVNILLGLAFAALVAGAVQVWRRHLAVARREDLRALAARRGWSLTETGGAFGRAGTLRFAPRGGHPWTAEVCPADGSGRGPSTEYESEGPRWAEGTLLLVAAALPPEAGPEAALPHPAAAGSDPRALRGLLGEDLARVALGLRRVPAPEGVTAFADADPARRVILADVARLMAAWRPMASGEKGAPVLVLSPEGTRLRLRHAIGRADRMERFVDLALDLSRVIGP